MKKMLQGRILDYTSIIFMTVVFVSLYYFSMSSHLYGFLLFLSFFPYFLKMCLMQKVQEDVTTIKEEKISLIVFLLTNFIIFSSFIVVIFFNLDFFYDSLYGLLLSFLFIYLTLKKYKSSFMICFFLAIPSFLTKEHSFLEIVSYIVYMYMILSNFKIKTIDKYLSKFKYDRG
jgi:hypothetical protein